MAAKILRRYIGLGFGEAAVVAYIVDAVNSIPG